MKSLTAARSVDVLVIGSGQAGLAAGYWLARTPLSFLLVDGVKRVGDSWRARWDSLTLFTPAAYSSLPGLRVPGLPDADPTKDSIADYLERYAQHFQLPVQLGSRVTELVRQDGRFRATLSSGGDVVAEAVVVATGAFQVPAIPPFAARLDRSVVQLTPSTYKNPQATPRGTVLIVGDGSTGRQIALELAASRRVLLATGRPRRVSPERILGRSVFWWLEKVGVLDAPHDSLVGRFLRKADPFPGSQLRLNRLAERGVAMKPRVESVAGDEVTFADRSHEHVAMVLWSTGYRDESGWMAIDGALDDGGQFIQWQGRSPVAGLYYVGRSWQRTRGSALLLGVGDDARVVVDGIRLQIERRSSRVAHLAEAYGG
jgi:putative flavoprotein involved in K+ transport